MINIDITQTDLIIKVTSKSLFKDFNDKYEYYYKLEDYINIIIEHSNLDKNILSYKSIVDYQEVPTIHLDIVVGDGTRHIADYVYLYQNVVDLRNKLLISGIVKFTNILSF